MADRYWVGGSGTWDSATTTNWSTTSGGTSGASAPTIADQAIFNASSGTGTVTIGSGATCLTLTASAITANTKFDGRTSSGGVFNPVILSTNATFASAATFVNYALDIEFQGTVATSILNNASTTVLYNVSNTKTSGVLSIATSNCTCTDFYQNSATATLTTNLTCTNFYLLGGTFNINAAILTVSTYFTDDDSGTSRSIVTTTGTLNVGTSITTTALTAVTYNLNNSLTTFTAGTGTVVIGSTTAQATNTTFYHGCTGNLRDVLFQGTKTFIYGGAFGVSLTVAGATTAGFRVTTPAAINHELSIDTRISVTVTGGTFSVVGNSVTNRALIEGDQMGTANGIILTGTATRTLTNVDLQDITFTYGSALTGTSIGDCGNNSGVTVTTAVTCYAKTGASAFNYSGAMWFTTSGGSTTQRVPLPQDTVIFDSNTGSGVVTVNARTLGGAITTTGWTGSFSISLLSDCIPAIYGQYTGTGSLLNPITRVKFGARANTTIPANGITATLFIDCINFTATLAGAINSADVVLWVHSGTLNTSGSNYAITASNLNLDPNYSSYTGSRSGGSNLTLNASTVTLTAKTSAIVINVPSAFGTITPNTSTINITPTGSFAALSINSGSSFSTVTLTPNSSMTSFTKTGNSTFTSFTCSTSYPFTFFFGNSSTNTFTTLSLTGTASAPIVVRPVTLTTSGVATLAIASASITRFTAFRQITKSGASSLTAYNVADLGGNTSITFAAQTKTYAFNTGAGSFTVPNNYSNSNMLYVVGGGGGAQKRNAAASGSGGGGGATGITSNLSLTKGQTVYYSVGSGGTGATTNNTAGGTGGTSWVNTSANTTPATANIGAIAVGGTGPLGSTGLGGAANTAVNTIGIAGGSAGAYNTTNASGGGTAVGYAYLIARTGGVGASASGGGGAGIAANGGTAGGGFGGTGGAGVGSGGTGGANGTTTGGAGNAGGVSAGGGGGGSVSSTSATGGAGGAGGDGTDFSYIYLNGSAATGSVGPGGAGGGGGGYVTTSTGVTGGAGGAGSYGAGGGGSGRGGTVNGNGGNGGGGLVFFVYEISPGGNQGFVIG